MQTENIKIKAHLVLRPKFPWWNWVLQREGLSHPPRNLVMFLNDSDFLKVAIL